MPFGVYKTVYKNMTTFKTRFTSTKFGLSMINVPCYFNMKIVAHASNI